MFLLMISFKIVENYLKRPRQGGLLMYSPMKCAIFRKLWPFCKLQSAIDQMVVICN